MRNFISGTRQLESEEIGSGEPVVAIRTPQLDGHLTPKFTCGRIKQNASEASFLGSPGWCNAR